MNDDIVPGGGSAWKFLLKRLLKRRYSMPHFLYTMRAWGTLAVLAWLASPVPAAPWANGLALLLMVAATMYLIKPRPASD